MPNKLQRIYDDHGDEIDSLVSEFTRALDKMLSDAARAVSTEIMKELTIEDGIVSLTTRNQRLLNSLQDRLSKALDAVGYQDLLDNYTDGFNGQFVWFDKVLQTINEDLIYPLAPITFTKGQMAQFDASKMSARDLIEGATIRAAGRVRQQALFGVGGMNSRELTRVISETYGSSLGESQNLAETSISTFYRTVTDQGFRIIEEDLPGFEIRYNYEGPLDKLTRPFCTKLERQSRAGKTWTRAEINRMSNGQIPNVFTTAGGYRCRHQWVISVQDLVAEQRKKGAPATQASRRAPTRDEVQQEVRARQAVHQRRARKTLGQPHPVEQIRAIKAEAVERLGKALKERKQNV